MIRASDHGIVGLRRPECCDAKYRLQTNDRGAKFRLAAMRSLTALSAFLDVSSLNLAVPTRRRHFFVWDRFCGAAWRVYPATLMVLSLMRQGAEAFQSAWQTQWLVERGIEIISEASRRLPADLKASYPEIPWRNVAGIGNVRRYDDESVSAPVMWTVVQEHLTALDRVCRDELAAGWRADASRRGENRLIAVNFPNHP